VPPLPEAVAVPVLAPLHSTFVCEVILTPTAVGSVMVTVVVAAPQLFEAVTDTVYIPATTPEMVAVIAPLLQL